MRPSKRKPDELRRVSIERAVSMHAEGSCLIKFGNTHVLCTASLEERVPPWLKGQGRGWVTAEYGMLPRATTERTRREATVGHPSGRTQEIQRLIGRALRAVVDLPKLGERQISIDCDVIQADGGTRTAAITGAWVALHDCIKWMQARDMVKDGVLRDHVAAVSCGLYKGKPVLDLDYAEDSDADADANFVMTGSGGIVEVQGTAETVPFSPGELRPADGARQEGHRRAGRAAEADGGVTARIRSDERRCRHDPDRHSRDRALRQGPRRGRGLLSRRAGAGAVRQGGGPASLLSLRRPGAADLQSRRHQRAAGARRAARAAARHGGRGPRLLPRLGGRDRRAGAPRSRPRASPSRPTSSGRAAAARSTSAIPPATAWSSPSRASGGSHDAPSAARRRAWWWRATTPARCGRSTS